MLKEKPNYDLTVPKIMWGILIAASFAFLIYKAVVIETSEIVYTIEETIDYYTDSKSEGKIIQYKVGSKYYKESCITKECRNAKIGTRFLIHYYKDDPEFYEIHYDVRVPDNLEPPKEGWGEKPEL